MEQDHPLLLKPTEYQDLLQWRKPRFKTWFKLIKGFQTQIRLIQGFPLGVVLSASFVPVGNKENQILSAAVFPQRWKFSHPVTFNYLHSDHGSTDTWWDCKDYKTKLRAMIPAPQLSQHCEERQGCWHYTLMNVSLTAYGFLNQSWDFTLFYSKPCLDQGACSD